jgi:hypothetical protein
VIHFEVDWPPSARARLAKWLRFVPTATFDDPWADASATILVDLPSWPSANRPRVDPTVRRRRST